jgi:hypothetical protein
VGEQPDRRQEVQRRVIRYRVLLWTVVAALLFAFGLAALLSGDLGGLIPLAAAAMAGLVAYRTGREGIGHSVLTALFSRKAN